MDALKKFNLDPKNAVPSTVLKDVKLAEKSNNIPKWVIENLKNE
jgi:hypothetical protein